MLTIPRREHHHRKRSLVVFAMSGVFFVSGIRMAAAEDSIIRKGTSTPLPGDVTEVSRTEVVLKGRTNKREYRVPVNEIERVRWDGEKAQLNQARNDERNGRLDKALETYQASLKEVSPGNLRTDLEFLIARTIAMKALSEEDQYDTAIAQIEKFVAANPQSFRYFESLKILARLQMAKLDYDKASATLKLLADAPWNDFKMDAETLQARAALARNDVDTALKALDRVIAVQPNGAAEVSRRYEALLIKASCLEKQGKFPDAIAVLSGIFDDAGEEETKTLAETCLRLGDCFQAAGRTKEAILAYLRVDVLFPKEKNAHAEALYHLSQLFAKDSKPDKAADAAARLQETYPRSPWTAKLTVSPK